MNAFMPNFDLDRDTQPFPPKWEGLTEFDRAIAENRLTAYRWKKAWADPWTRRLTIAVLGMFCLYAGFVIYSDLLSK